VSYLRTHLLTGVLQFVNEITHDYNNMKETKNVGLK
jgi:hypothetical protein